MDPLASWPTGLNKPGPSLNWNGNENNSTVKMAIELIENVIIWYSSVMHQDQQYHSASLQWLHIWNHSWVRIQEFIISILRHPIIHFSHSVTSQKSQDVPSLDLSDYLAVHATAASRHLYIISWAHCGLAAPSFNSTPRRRFAVNAIMWLPKPKPKPKTGFGLTQNRNTGFTERTWFWKP